ncbi:diaminopimelate decarboxylase family protein [Streptomyces sp. NBC_01483]|uniref:diaminopimelate decarboxylase family protein n=1 Tax=Streptomyces sp. NBC_01483 TaxID=2903883 RepID=UPI002E31C974|nr:hypothetical protein [Streptomyces sp. NBC_01483]
MSIQELPVQELPVQETPVQEPHRTPGADSPGEAARADARDAEGLSVWPRSARPEPDADVSVGGVSLAEAADRFGTPVYVLDEQEVRERCRAYRTTFPDADIVYAAKAFLCRAMAHWVQEEGLGLDVCSAGELALAVTTGFPPEKIVMHGNAKSPEDLSTALRLGVGRIVVDSTSEIARLAAITPAGTRQPVMVRVVPGIAAGGHAKVRTGTDDQKFGRHCEAGDVLADEVALPGDVRPGDLLAVPAAGAYHLSMASGYNLVGRPPVVAVSHGIARVLVRRESLDDMSRRDVGL